MPHGIIRWGSGILLAIVFLLVGVSCFFSYPDAVYAEVTIETIQSPALIVARSSGKLEHLFVQNQQSVDSGAPLAVIENAANYHDMLKLSARLSQWNPTLNEMGQGLILFGDTLMQLGTVQSAYTDFIKALHDFDSYLHFAYYQQKKSLQKSQQQTLRLRLKEMVHQYEWQKKQLMNADALYKRDSLLYVKGITSEETWEESKNNLLKANQSVSALNASIYELETQLKQLDESMWIF
jgi:multidrug resistance efflux pump